MKKKPWPRWAKVMRNLLLALLLGYAVWALLEKPLPYEADLRRLKRQWLIPETECVAVVSRGIWGSDTRVEWTEGAAIASYPAHYQGELFSRAAARPYCLTDGPDLIALPWSAGLLDEWGQPHSYACYIALQPPEDSVSAVLTLHNDDGTFTVSSQREGDIFLFYARPEPNPDGSSHMGSSWFSMDLFTYKLAFYGKNGAFIQEISG